MTISEALVSCGDGEPVACGAALETGVSSGDDRPMVVVVAILDTRDVSTDCVMPGPINLVLVGMESSLLWRGATNLKGAFLLLETD